MKQFLGIFLAFLMIMPSLACSMPVCAHSGETPTSVAKPCHDEESLPETENKKPHDVRFVIDCMGVDLQKADTAHFDAPDLRPEPALPGIVISLFTAENRTPADDVIRGPPPPGALAPFSPPASLILTTGRLRV